jgi:hypothetical protein
MSRPPSFARLGCSRPPATATGTAPRMLDKLELMVRPRSPLCQTVVSTIRPRRAQIQHEPAPGVKIDQVGGSPALSSLRSNYDLSLAAQLGKRDYPEGRSLLFFPLGRHKVEGPNARKSRDRDRGRLGGVWFKLRSYVGHSWLRGLAGPDDALSKPLRSPTRVLSPGDTTGPKGRPDRSDQSPGANGSSGKPRSNSSASSRSARSASIGRASARWTFTRSVRWFLKSCR